MTNKRRLIGSLAAALLIHIAIRIVNSDALVMVHELVMGSEWGFKNLFLTICPYSITQTVVYLGIFLGVYRAPARKFKGSDGCFAALFASLFLLGYSFDKIDSWSLLFSKASAAVLTVVAWLGIGLGVLVALAWIGKLAARFAAASVRLPQLFTKHPFLCSWAAMMIAWLPWMIIRYPAGIEYDAYYQIEEALGILPLGAKNPFVSSLFMGFWVWLGKAVFGSYNVGVFLLVLAQALLCSAALAYTVKAMGRMGVSKNWQALTLGVYAMVPIFAGYLTAVIKDAMFSCATVLFVTLLAEELYLPCRLPHKIALGAAAFGMCALRNNGLYVLTVCVAVFAIGCLVRRKAGRLSLTAALAAAMVLYIGANSVLITALDVQEGSIAEALSVPFQQTARYLREYPEEVTEEEVAAIDAVLDYENLASLYDPDISDPVKSTYRGDAGALPAYFKVWFKQFLRHPGVYLEATLNNTCGYYYPDNHLFIFYGTTWSMDELQLEEPAALAGAKKVLSNWVWFFETMPVLMLIGCTAVHFWLVLLMLWRAAQRKDGKLLLLLIPSLVAMTVCLAGPTFTTNGVRYALPFIYANPLLLGIAAFRTKQE